MANDYNIRNAHLRDSRISFNAHEHIYMVDGIPVPRSVTQLVGEQFAPFDAETMSLRKAGGDPVLAARLRRQWRHKAAQAAFLGTVMHDSIERHYLGEVQQRSVEDFLEYGQFLDFARDYRLTPYRTEWAVFSEKYGLAGTLDFLNFDGRVFEIYDWKRSTKIVDEQRGCINTCCYNRYSIGVVKNIPDTSFHHYALQLSIYRYLLAEEYGIEVSAAHLGVFHPDNNSYHVVDVPYYEAEVRAILQNIAVR